MTNVRYVVYETSHVLAANITQGLWKINTNFFIDPCMGVEKLIWLIDAKHKDPIFEILFL